jgi:hypothetical protein
LKKYGNLVVYVAQTARSPVDGEMLCIVARC